MAGEGFFTVCDDLFMVDQPFANWSVLGNFARTLTLSSHTISIIWLELNIFLEENHGVEHFFGRTRTLSIIIPKKCSTPWKSLLETAILWSNFPCLMINPSPQWLGARLRTWAATDLHGIAELGGLLMAWPSPWWRVQPTSHLKAKVVMANVMVIAGRLSWPTGGFSSQFAPKMAGIITING